MEATDYREKYVLYMDILGFSSQVSKADIDIESRNEVKMVLRTIRDTLCNNPNTGLIFTYFSDCIVVSTDRTLEGMREMIASIKWLSINLLNRGYLVRGGLTVGLIHHDSDFVFGLPLIEAHRLESDIAINARTIISEGVLEDVGGYGDEYMLLFFADSDGRYFINYLIDYKNYSQYRGMPGTLILDYSVNYIINHIQKKLNQYTGRPLQKVVWFQTYWNEEVASQGIFARIELGVADELPNASPTIVHRRLIKQ